MRRHLVDDERGQMLPLLMVLIVAMVAVGLAFLQVGRAATMRSEAQTAADAAALAGARELAGGVAGLYDTASGFDEAAVRAAAADYARRNGAELVDLQVRYLDVLVTVRTEEELGKDAASVDSEDVAATATARARLNTAFGGAGAVPTGSLSAGVRDAIALAQSMGLSVSSSLRPGDIGSLHSQGLAADLVGTPEQMAAFYHAALERYSYIEELFYDPIGGIDKNISIGPIGGHSDHVHIAMLGVPLRAGQEEGEAEAELPGGADAHDAEDPHAHELDPLASAAPQLQLVAYDDPGPATPPSGSYGGWAIPEAIVMCESGGDFTAVNPTSGAGGAYQILPSTWAYYGGEGLPQNAPPAEQHRIAALIWADSGPAAWECAP